MANYSYKKGNNKYRLFEDDKPVSTPHGNPIIAESEELAQKLVGAFERGEDYTSGGSLLTFHYTYCNMIADYSLENLAEDLGVYADYDHLLYDDYLMFRQSAPVKQAIAGYLADEIPAAFKRMNFYQLTAMVVFNTIEHSWILPYMLIVDIIEQMGDAEYKELKEAFLNDIVEYECETFGCDSEDDQYKEHLNTVSATIDMFVEYFTIE